MLLVAMMYLYTSVFREPTMHETAKDALSESYSVLVELIHFLRTVETSVDPKSRSELAIIGQNLESVANRIAKHVDEMRIRSV